MYLVETFSDLAKHFASLHKAALLWHYPYIEQLGPVPDIKGEIVWYEKIVFIQTESNLDSFSVIVCSCETHKIL